MSVARGPRTGSGQTPRRAGVRRVVPSPDATHGPRHARGPRGAALGPGGSFKRNSTTPIRPPSRLTDAGDGDGADAAVHSIDHPRQSPDPDARVQMVRVHYYTGAWTCPHSSPGPPRRGSPPCLAWLRHPCRPQRDPSHRPHAMPCAKVLHTACAAAATSHATPAATRLYRAPSASPPSRRPHSTVPPSKRLTERAPEGRRRRPRAWRPRACRAPPAEARWSSRDERGAAR